MITKRVLDTHQHIFRSIHKMVWKESAKKLPPMQTAFVRKYKSYYRFKTRTI